MLWGGAMLLQGQASAFSELLGSRVLLGFSQALLTNLLLLYLLWLSLIHYGYATMAIPIMAIRTYHGC